MLQRLEAADRLAELLTDTQVVEGDLLRLFHHAQHFGGECKEREMMERLHGVGPQRMRRDEIGRRIRQAQSRKPAALYGLRCRQRAAGGVARHVAKHGPIAPGGADQETIGAVGAHKYLLAGQMNRAVAPYGPSTRGKRVVVWRALLQRRHDEPLALHHLLQLWMPRARLCKHRSPDSREPARLHT